MSIEFPSEQIILPSIVGIEFVAVKVRFKNITLFVSCSYIPPGSDVTIYSKHVSAIQSAFQTSALYDTLVVLGDFNLPSITWNQPDNSNILVPVMVNNCVNVCIESLLCHGLFQVNNVYNFLGKLLDLVFVNQPSEISLNSSAPVTNPEDRFHPTIDLRILLPSTTSSTNISNSIRSKKVYCFSRTDYPKLNSLLSAINWNDILSSKVLDVVINNFYSVLHDCISKSVPKIFKRDSIGPPWNTNQLAKSKNKKNKLFKKYKKTGTSADFYKYSVARSEYNIENKRAYNNYIITMKRQLSSNPKSFYKFVNSKRRSHSFPNSLKFGTIVADNDESISNIFAEFFSTTYSNTIFDQSIPYPYNIVEATTINVSIISRSTVLENLKSLKNTFSPGPDGIPANILKYCADNLSSPLSIIFNKSIRCGYLTPLWKESYIIPLFKSGSKIDVSNYRGIAKLSAIPKLLEKIITDMLSHQVSSLLSCCQHGFRKSRSTITNILELTTVVNEGFRNRMQTDTIYTDFSKAFDKVNHNLLFIKLDAMGFSNTLLSWLKCYLGGRTQRVKFGNALSRKILVSSGVPQGSHLGPVLFTLFINDLPSVILHSNILMYADDVKIFRSFNNPTEQHFLQSDLDSFHKWCKINLMELNILKCKQMSFCRVKYFRTNYFFDVHELEAVVTFLDLGILLDQRLNFRPHISMIINKAYGALGFMKRWSKEFSDPSVTKQLYTSLVRCMLEYGSVVWDPSYTIHSNLLESVQKQFLLFCLRGRGWNPRTLPSYEFRLNLIKLPSLKSRRTMLNITFLMNVIHGNIKSDFLINKIVINIPSRPSRNFHLLHVDYFRTNYANNDPFRRLCVEFNKYYHIIELSENRDSIKRKIILHLNT